MDQDECWFSRFAQPHTHAWSDSDKGLRLLQRDPPSAEKEKALACFGAVRQDTQQVYLYFSDGQPNTEQMCRFMEGLLKLARQEDKQVLVLIWDNASWHKSKRMKQWIRDTNRRAKARGDVRLITHLLPVKSPWLNPIEPRWIHAKRSVCEPNGNLTAAELRARLCHHFNVEPFINTLKESDAFMH